MKERDANPSGQQLRGVNLTSMTNVVAYADVRTFGKDPFHRKRTLNSSQQAAHGGCAG